MGGPNDMRRPIGTMTICPMKLPCKAYVPAVSKCNCQDFVGNCSVE